MVHDDSLSSVGAVVIGRNEGQRLDRCLASLGAITGRVVYVDSGSTDDSLAIAERHNAMLVELDTSVPFTAARARNAGFEHLLGQHSDLAWVQFVDGDCEVQASWLSAALAFAAADSKLAVVCGRRRERFPEASVYNEFCDIEWDTPVGKALACGGDALMRVEALQQVGGYDGRFIAGEEPELCVRLRRAGFEIYRMDQEMTLHDADMHHVRQWWKRAVRCGYAYAMGFDAHGDPPEEHYKGEIRRSVMWGGALPAAIALGTGPTLGLSWLLSAGYGISTLRAYQATRRRGRERGESARYAAACTAAKFAEFQGVVRYHWEKHRGMTAKIIEYK